MSSSYSIGNMFCEPSGLSFTERYSTLVIAMVYIYGTYYFNVLMTETHEEIKNMTLLGTLLILTFHILQASVMKYAYDKKASILTQCLILFIPLIVMYMYYQSQLNQKQREKELRKEIEKQYKVSSTKASQLIPSVPSVPPPQPISNLPPHVMQQPMISPVDMQMGGQMASPADSINQSQPGIIGMGGDPMPFFNGNGFSSAL